MAGRLPVRANQTDSQPALTGPAERESTMNTRTLQIERTGDFWRGNVIPKIRLNGKWLERAGFRAGHRVEVTMEQPGTLTLRFLADTANADAPMP